MAAFNFHRRKTRRWWYAGITLVAAAFFSVFYVVGASATLPSSPSSFETSDGNMVVDTSNSSDWNCFANGVNSTFANPGNSTPSVNVAASGVTGACGSSSLDATKATQEADPNAGTSQDKSWVSGQKMDLQCAKTTTGNNPSKDTFDNVAQYNETDPSTHDLYLYGATIRASANGNANENVELSQKAGTATCPINRSNGDKLLLINFPGNNTAPTVQLLTYYTTSLPSGTTACFNTSTHKPPCWANPQNISNDFEGAVNLAAIAGNDNGLNQQPLAADVFAEFGANLSNALDLSATTCFTSAQQTWESRSSSSFSSNPEDIEIFNQPISNCGSLLIHKTDGSGNGLAGATFTATPGATSSTGTATSSTFTDEGNGYYCLDNMLLGQSTVVTETAAPAGYNVDPNSQTLTVSDTDSCATRLAATDVTSDGSDFVDTPQVGAIVITKTGKDKSCTGVGTSSSGADLSCKDEGVRYLGGAAFELKQNGTTMYTSGSTDGTTGQICIGDVTPGSYTLHEKTVPTGYSGASDSSVTISGNTTCSGTGTAAPATASVVDLPLTTITVSTTPQVAGATASTAYCALATASATGSSTGDTSGQTTPYTTTNAVTPGTYTCTVVIDP